MTIQAHLGLLARTTHKSACICEEARLRATKPQGHAAEDASSPAGES